MPYILLPLIPWLWPRKVQVTWGGDDPKLQTDSVPSSELQASLNLSLWPNLMAVTVIEDIGLRIYIQNFFNPSR